jgi:hypothetical protein
MNVMLDLEAPGEQCQNVFVTIISASFLAGVITLYYPSAEMTGMTQQRNQQ